MDYPDYRLHSRAVSGAPSLSLSLFLFFFLFLSLSLSLFNVRARIVWNGNTRGRLLIKRYRARTRATRPDEHVYVTRRDVALERARFPRFPRCARKRSSRLLPSALRGRTFETGYAGRDRVSSHVYARQQGRVPPVARPATCPTRHTPE